MFAGGADPGIYHAGSYLEAIGAPLVAFVKAGGMMEIGDYWAALVRGWWLIAIFGLAGLAIPLLLASPPKGHIETHYESTSIVGSPPTAQGSPIGGGISTGQSSTSPAPTV